MGCGPQGNIGDDSVGQCDPNVLRVLRLADGLTRDGPLAGGLAPLADGFLSLAGGLSSLAGGHRPSGTRHEQH